MKREVTFAALLAISTGCSVAARSPEMFRDETTKLLATKSDAIRACYDGVLKAAPHAEGRVTVKFEVETEQGKVSNVTVDKANTTAPVSVAECVTKNIDGLAVVPPDSRVGHATWVYDFAAPLAVVKGPNKT